MNEDIRSLTYCRDSYEMLMLFVDYYYAVYEGKSGLDKITDSILKLGEKMSEYTFGVKYDDYTPDIKILDVLTRSKFDVPYYKLLAKLNKNS